MTTISDVVAAGYTAEAAQERDDGTTIYAVSGPGVALTYVADTDQATLAALADPRAVAARLAQENG